MSAYTSCTDTIHNTIEQGNPTEQQKFADIMVHCLAQGCQMRILTNAIVYSPYIAETLEKHNSEVNINLDSGTPATYHRIKGVDKFHEATRNLARYSRKGRCQVKYTVCQDNRTDEDLFGFLGFCAKLPQKLIQISLDMERTYRETDDGECLMFMAKMSWLAKVNTIPCEYDMTMVTPAQIAALEKAEAWITERSTSIFPRALAATHALKTESPFCCPLCKTRITHYDPIPSGLAQTAAAYGYRAEPLQPEFFNRDRMTCPHCGGMDRERISAEYLLRKLGKNFADPHFVLMEFAPRPIMRDFLQREFVLTHKTADISMPDVDFTLDMTNMPAMASTSVNAWLCLHILEHIPDDDAALRELLRILRPGGFGLLLTPISLALPHTDEDFAASPAERWRRFGQDDHVRFYAKDDFVAKLGNAGFTVFQLDRQWFGQACYTQLGLPDSAVLYVVEKPKSMHDEYAI